MLKFYFEYLETLNEAISTLKNEIALYPNSNNLSLALMDAQNELLLFHKNYGYLLK